MTRMEEKKLIRSYLDYLIINNHCTYTTQASSMKELGFLLASMRAQRGISEWIAKTSHWKARRFDRENIVGLVGTLCGFYSLTETGRIGDRKTEQAFNEHGLMSKANRYYTRVSLDQSRWKWSLLNEENISRQSFPSPAFFHVKNTLF